MLLNQIKNKAPKSYEEFEAFYNENYDTFKNEKGVKLNDLPDELIIGIFFYFFEENAIEFDAPDYSPENLKDEIVNAMIGYEDVIDHYS